MLKRHTRFLVLLGLLLCPQQACDSSSGSFGSGGDDDDIATDDDDTATDDDDTATDPCDGVVPTSGTDIDLDPVVTGLQDPVFVTHAGDGSGRIFLVEQRGEILSWSEGGGTAAWLDLSSSVTCCGERGLLSMAFHPQFATNGRFYVYYSEEVGWDLTTVVSEFTVNGNPLSDLPDPSSEVVLLTEAEPAGNHNGGQLAFGPDGMLYIGLGDGGGAGDTYGNGQNPDTFHSKILRIDVDGTGEGAFGNYAVPPDNPFFQNAAHRPETWAWGFRNPWRFSFDRQTGELWIADVGQNQWEEINIGVSGANYGWPQTEGNHCYLLGCDLGAFEAPVSEYPRTTGISITGGYVYRGCALPDLDGTYFYSDYNYWNSPLWSLSWDGASATPGPVDLGTTGGLISSFGEDEQGEVYIADHSGGRILKIVPAN